MSRRLPSLTPRKVLQVLTGVGFYIHHTSGSHHILRHPTKQSVRVTLPWHNRDLKQGTLRSIIEQAGFTTEEFAELL